MKFKDREYSFQDLLKEIKKRSREEGVQSDYEYLDLIDDILEQKKNEGYFSEDEDLEQLKDDLELMWPEVERYLQSFNK